MSQYWDSPHATRIKIHVFIQQQGQRGATADEVAADLSIPLLSVGPRMLELRQKGLIVDAGYECPTRLGSMARVYVATEHAPGAEGVHDA